MPVTTRYQTTTPYESLADFLARLLDPDGSAEAGLYWGGEFSSGSSFPAFLAMVQDDSGRMWPCGTTGTVPIEFDDTGSGTYALFLIPFSDESLPSFATGQIGDFSLVAQASGTPDDALLIGSGSCSGSSFSDFTEDSGARVKVTASSLLPLTELTSLASGDLLK